MREAVCLARRFALAVVLVVLSAGAALAADPYRGRFTLPHEVRWGRAVLPPGEYSLVMDSDRDPLRVLDSSGRVRVLAFGIPDSSRAGQSSSLLVTRDGAEYTVRSFNCPLWDRNFVYKPFSRAERDLLASGGRVETLLVRVASR